MAHAQFIGGQWVEIGGPFTDANGVQHAANLVDLWSAEELADIGVALITDDLVTPPSNLRITGTELADVAGVPTRRYVTAPYDLADRKVHERRLLQAIYDAKRQRYPVTLGGNAEFLQLRDGTQDIRNWQVLQRRAEKQVALGNGDDLAALPIRVESNAQYQLSYAQIAALLEGMEDWGAGLMAVSWVKGDALQGAATHDALNEVMANINTGWPA